MIIANQSSITTFDDFTDELPTTDSQFPTTTSNDSTDELITTTKLQRHAYAYAHTDSNP